VRIEIVPLILGIIVALLAIGIIFDAWTPDAVSVSSERRRRPRIERHRNGEALIGFGVLALAAAFIGRDSWRYSVLVVIIGAVLLVVGAVLNASYLRELFVNRGPLRRRETQPGHTEIARAADASIVPTDAHGPDVPGAATADPSWDGVERRKTPREANRRSSRRGPPPEDAPHG
jgi:hypothetical protein